MRTNLRVILEISAHHCHLSAADFARLFGPSARLHPARPISQPGQFAAREVIRVKIGSGVIRARVVGPVRIKSQVEISRTLAVQLGVNPPVTYFGDGAARRVPCTLIGPTGRVNRRAVIIAQPHLHCDPATARKAGLRGGQMVSVRTHGDRPVTFHRVVVRVHPKFKLRCHLDTDEANAAGVKSGDRGTMYTT